MADHPRSQDHIGEHDIAGPPKPEHGDFEPPAITKLGTLTRVVKASAGGSVTIGAGVG